MLAATHYTHWQVLYDLDVMAESESINQSQNQSFMLQPQWPTETADAPVSSHYQKDQRGDSIEVKLSSLYQSGWKLKYCNVYISAIHVPPQGMAREEE